MGVASLSSLTAIRLKRADTADALLCSDASGWNQVAEDWQLFIERGNTFGFRDSSGRLIATAAALPYAGDVGWISMVLVAEEYRHRGLATRLMEDCIGTLTDANITPVLDATPAGEAVYARLGFRSGFGFDRWERDSVDDASAQPINASTHPLAGGATIVEIGSASSAKTRHAIVELDASLTGVGRGFVIESFLARPGSRAWLTSDGRGFVIGRAGHRAAQIGPLAARDDAQAIELLDAAVVSTSARIFIDVPAHRDALIERLQGCGFRKQRPYRRMALGITAILQCPDQLFGLAGPEFG